MTTLKNPKRTIDTFLTADGKMHERLHNLLVDLLVYSKDNSKKNYIAYLLSGLHKSRRKGAIINWLTKYSPVLVSTADKGETYKANLKGKTEWNIEEAQANPYWKKEDTELKQELYTLAKAMGTVKANITRLRTIADKGEVDDVEAIRAFADNLEEVLKQTSKGE